MPPEAPDAWADVLQPISLSRLEPLYTPPLAPKRLGRRSSALVRALLMIVLPTVLSGVYFGLIAADRYVSEASFVVRKPGNPTRMPGQTLSIDDGPKGLGGDDSYALRDYLDSRDALALLLEKTDFRDAVGRAGIDWAWRFPGPLTGHTDEDLYKLYQSLVSVDYDSSTGVTELEVQAFDAETARRMAVVLMDGGEALLNRMNARAQADAIHVAENEVARDRQRAIEAQDQVTAFRNRESIIDPTQISKTVLNTIAALSLQLVENRAELEVTRQASPNSPQIAQIRSRVTAIQQQIDHERGTLVGNDGALAPRIAAYERLTLQQGFAAKTLITAMTQLEVARLDSLRKQDYLERVVEPRAADEAKRPHRVLWVIGTFLAGCLVFRMFRPRGAVRA